MPTFDRGIATENYSAGLRGNGALAHGGYRFALRNFLDLHFVPPAPAADIQQRIAARLEEHDYEEAQLDAEQALLLANVAPPDDED